MVEFTGHIRLVASNQARRTDELAKPSQSKPAQGANGSETSDQSVSNPTPQQDVVNLVSLENRRASHTEDRPTFEEAEQALRDLQADLPGTDRDLGEIHSKLDRRLILGLLAPLVSG